VFIGVHQWLIFFIPEYLTLVTLDHFKYLISHEPSTMSMEPKLTPEESLIYTVSKVNLDNRDSVRLHDILKQNLDWSIIKRYARQLGVSPLLFKHLSKEGRAHYVPDETMLYLRKSYVYQLGKNFRLYNEIDKILSLMNRSNIPIVLLKGAYLAKYIYKDIALRPMGDIDILVREGDSEIVQKKVIELGYKKSTAYHASSFHEGLSYDDVKHLTPMVKSGCCPVEVHLDIFPDVNHDSKDMINTWETMQDTNQNGYQLKSLSPEYQIVYLCLHLCSHINDETLDSGIRLFWFCDIHEIIMRFRDKINWDSVYSIVSSIGAGAQVNIILTYIRCHWNTPIPETALHYLENEPNESSLTSIIRSILNGTKAKKSHIHRYINKTKIPLSRKVGKNSFCYLWREVFPKRSNLIYRYGLKNSSFVYVYYIIHPCKLLIRAVTSTFHNFIHLL